MEKIRSIYMKKTVFAFLALFAITGLFAQQQPVVAVAPFDVISGVSATDAAMITDVFFVRLGNTRKVDLVNRTIVQRVIREHNFQLEDWSNKEKTAELGKALNADWIVQGDIRTMNNGILIIVQFYNIKTFKFEGGTDLRLANADEAYEKMNPLVDSLLQTITASPPPAPAYKIGDRGPGGGIIFFAENDVYMECSMDIGTYNWDQAVSTAKNYKGGGFTDWHLPTIGELDLMYKNLAQKRLGGFGGNEYWSSSQISKNKAWARYFDDFRHYEKNKSRILLVRAVRAF